ncbi:MAG: type II toxin-antitoxin system VapC family toxin [Dehalococcoidia bacterium]|nr:type II toxin-antitoxin system VapC family toxin [Dehalococcoidia bacterium]
MDTSMVVRYLIGDPPNMAEQAARVIDTEDDLQVTDGVLMETAYVLTSVYGVAREVVVDHLIDFLQKENIDTFRLDKDQASQALLLCRPSGRVSFADALLWAAAQSLREKVVYSLDPRFPSADIEVRGGR